MAISTSIALMSFSLVSTLSPGPNNVMLFASGMNFGVKRTLPHICGVWVGFGLLVFGAGLGMTSLLEIYPSLNYYMMAVATAYLLYFAYKIAMSQPVDLSAETGMNEQDAEEQTQPMSFMQAVLFQWVNPKAWFIALGIATVYFKNADIMMTAYYSAVVAIGCMPSGTVWMLMGLQAKRFVNPDLWSVVNKVLAVLLVITMLPVIYETFQPLFVT